jgi:hypothetical protein
MRSLMPLIRMMFFNDCHTLLTKIPGPPEFVDLHDTPLYYLFK